MEPLHVIPPPVTSDIFYDVANSVYHQHHYHNHALNHVQPPQSTFWHQSPSRINRPEHHDVITSHHRVAYTEPALFVPSRNNDKTSDALADNGHGDNTPCGGNSDSQPPLADGDDVISRQEDAAPSPATEEHGGASTNADQVESKDWCGGHDDPLDDETSQGDQIVTDRRPRGEDSTSGKESQVTATLKWLNTNYELSEGVCLPRCVLYVHYLDFCKRQAFRPAGAATFGKLIRQKFKNITTRRLGTRGQSKYHYYGIGIKETSIYYQSVYTGKGLTRFSGIKIKTEGTSRKYSLGSKTGTLLPDFPSAHNLILPGHIAVDKMDTFLMMYRTHSQRILDTVISANFEEIQNLLIHFWQGYPQHLLDVLQLPVTVEVVALCDSILYKVLLDVLIPGSIQDLPESLSTDLRAFLRSLPRWVDNSLDDFVPDTVRQVKSRVLQSFLRAMKRQLAFVKMATTARPHLTNLEVTTQALTDLDTIDLDQMCIRTGFALNDKSLGCSGKAVAVFSDLKCLLRKQSAIEALVEWLDNLIDKNVLQDEIVPTKFKERASRFLLQWTMFGALIMKDLTLNSAKSFSFLHLVKMTLDEYVFLVMETQTDRHQDQVLQGNLQVHMKTAEEIQTSAKVRTQANRLQGSPKTRKRKFEDTEPSKAGVERDHGSTTPTQPPCQSFQSPPNLASEPVVGTAFSRPLSSDARNQLDTDNATTTANTTATTTTTGCTTSTTVEGCCTTAAAIAQANEVLRPTTITPHHAHHHHHHHHPLSISPIKGYAPYDRPAYLPVPPPPPPPPPAAAAAAFSLNSYTDYIGHHHHHHHPHSNTAFPSARQVPPTTGAFPSDPHHAHTQPFQPMTFTPTAFSLNSTTPPSPPSYWTPDGRAPPHPPAPPSHNSSSTLTDAYSQLAYNSYHHQPQYDPYQKPSSLLRAASVYQHHQDSFARPPAAVAAAAAAAAAVAGTSALDGFPRSKFDGLDLARATGNVALDNLARSCGSLESSRSAVPYYARPHDYHQGSSFSYGNTFTDVAPPSGQFGKQEGLLYQDDLFASNMAAASSLASFGKSYLTSGFR